MMAHDRIKFSDSEEDSLSSNKESDDEFDPNEDDDAKKRGFIAKKKSKTPAGRGRRETLKTPMALAANMSEYEKIRQGNIAEREEMLQELIADFSSFKKDSGIGAVKKAPLKKRKKMENGSDDEAEIRVKKAKVVGSRRSAAIPEEEMVEGLARSVQAPPPVKRVKKSRATSPPRSTRPVRLLSPPPLGRFLLLGRSSRRITDLESASLLLDTWQTCTGSPPDLTFITIKDGVTVYGHRLLLPPTSYLRAALDNSTCCGEASQVFIDGVCSEALMAALSLLYYGKCEVRDVSEDDVKEAANALGFPYSCTHNFEVCKSEAPKLVPNVGDGADFDNFSWTQTSDSVRIRATLPFAVDSRACVRIKLSGQRHLKVVVRQSLNKGAPEATVIDKTLHRKADLGSLDGNIKPLESGLGHNKPTSTGWSLVEKKYVVILLKKVEWRLWSKLMSAHPEIDLKEVKRRKNLEKVERLSLERALEEKVAREDGTMCRVEGCFKKFVHSWQRLKHEASFHDRNRLHCDMCDKTYSLSGRTSLLYHKLVAHNVEIKCSKCPLSFTDHQAYIVHRKKCRKLVLPEAGGHSQSAYNPNRVRLGTPKPGSNRLSSLSGKTKCKLCGKIILTKNMSRHMKEKHNDSSVTGLQEKPVKCTICDQEFQSMRSVPRHMKKFHDKSAD